MAKQPEHRTEAPAVQLDDWDVEETQKVRCIIHLRPWTHKAGLEFGEVADVPMSIALRMKEFKQVEFVAKGE